MLPEEGRRRVIIEQVTPEIEAGRHPIKRILDEETTVEAIILADGHEVVCMDNLLTGKVENIGHLDGFKMFVTGGNRDDVAPVSTVGNDNRTTEEIRRVTVGSGGFEGFLGGAPSPGIEHCRIKNKRVCLTGNQPGDDFPRVIRRQKTFIAAFSPMQFYSNVIAGSEGNAQFIQKVSQGADIRFFPTID